MSKEYVFLTKYEANGTKWFLEKTTGSFEQKFQQPILNGQLSKGSRKKKFFS